MILYYKFDDIVCNMLCSAAEHINAGWFEPHYCRAVADEYEFDLDVDVKPIDLAEFLLGRGSSEIDQKYLDALKDVINELEGDIEENERFKEFMKEKYEEKAHDLAQEEANDAC